MAKILIADDEDISRKAIEKAFHKFGECLAVDSGGDAISAFKLALKQERPYAVVVLDISLGDKSGIEVLTSLREMEKEQGLTGKEQTIIIMLSGNREVQIIKDCVVAGCNDYILKPVKPSVIASKLSALGFTTKE